MKTDGTIELARLREVVSYDPATGVFTWLVSLSWRRPLGSECGEVKADSGYRLIGIDGIRYRAHRLAWFYMTGEWPLGQVDHKNGVRHDNRWANLRIATQIQNSANMKTRISNRLGIKGVSLYQGPLGTKYRASLSVGGRHQYLGSFDNPEAAKRAYEAAAVEAFGEFARSS